MANVTEILGQRIRFYRKQKGISQEQLSKLADLHPTYIGQIERGEKNASIETIYKISMGLQIPIIQLLEKIDEYPYSLSESLEERDKKGTTSRSIPLQAYDLISEQNTEDQKNLLNILIYSLKLKR